MQRSYEVMFIVRPDMEEADVDKLIGGLEQTITQGGGVLKSTEKLGRRKLSYMVRKFNDGNYVLLVIQAEGGLMAEVERRLRVTEPVIKSIRASRKKLSAQPAAAAPEAEAAPAATEAAASA
jgi:small subunit ribosomal protein S6